MPLKKGYSEKTLRANIALMENEGKPRDQAVRVSLDWARVSYFLRHPQGHLPAYLKLPNGRRDRAAFDRYYGHAMPAPKKAPRKMKENPIQDRQTRVNAAMKLYSDFTGERAKIVGTYMVQKVHDVGVAIGPCCGIAYETVRDGERLSYFHEFAKKDRPLLVSSFDGKQLYMLGGAYDFTENGIVDASDKRYSPRQKGKGK
jgi:hypothetical protein